MGDRKQRYPDTVRIHVAGFFCDDESNGHLAPTLIRLANHRCFGDFRVLNQDRFEFSGIDILSAGYSEAGGCAGQV